MQYNKTFRKRESAIQESKCWIKKRSKSEEDQITLGSSGFLRRSWFKTSTHSANFPDWKCNAASLESAAATERTASSSAGEGPSRFAAADDDDEDKSRASINGSTPIGTRDAKMETLSKFEEQKTREKKNQIRSEVGKFTWNRKP